MRWPTESTLSLDGLTVEGLDQKDQVGGGSPKLDLTLNMVESGEELWSFMPNELLDRSAALLFNPSAQYKSYGIDGDVVPVFLDRDEQ